MPVNVSSSQTSCSYFIFYFIFQGVHFDNSNAAPKDDSWEPGLSLPAGESPN